jgi:glycosyltransferase involved in cell wall biosynthesis
MVPYGVNPVDLGKPLDAIRPDIEMILKRQPLILFLGRINWKKGLDRLIPALALVPRAQLVIAGNDEEKYSVFLRKLIDRCGVQDRVTFTGAVHGDDKVALLRAATIFVLPSYSENFGIAVLEAMAYGCPVIVTPEVGLADAVRSHQAGLISEGTPLSLSKSMSLLIEDPDLCRTMGQAGREAVRSVFLWDVVTRQMETLYSLLIASSKDNLGLNPKLASNGLLCHRRYR